MTNNETERTEALALSILDEALDVPERDRHDWVEAQTKGDDVLRARVFELLKVDASDVSLTGQAATTLYDEMEQDAPERIGQYKVERLIGKGGMGSVYLGVRDSGDFDHEVAIKVVRGLRNLPKLSERLRAERQTLAQLKHPHIAQLFDGGETEAGDPYFIMEYVEGKSLRETLSTGDVSLQERLALIEQIGQAVQHAHQKLIIHRDLSPSNILVTDNLQAKLIDFGISQSLSTSREDGASRYTLTKGYAAPERLRGDPATTLSDIYALGVIFKEMVSGISYARPEDLNAIFDKATHADPDLRYQSVGALLGDIDRYRGKRSVPALSSAPNYRVKRFVGRHKVSVTAGVLATLALIATTIVTSVMFVRAERAEAEATQRFDDVRSLAKFVLFDLYNDLDTVPGTTAVREKMALRSREYLDALSEDPDAPFALRVEIANGYKRLGDVMGNPITGHLGKTDESAVLLKKAYDDLKGLETERPNDETVLRSLAETAYSYSVFTFIAIDDNQGALDLAKESQAYYERLVAQPDPTIFDQLGLLGARVQAADALVYLERGEESIAEQKQVIASMNALLEQYPDDQRLQRNASTAMNNIAGAYYQHYDVGAPELAEGIAYAEQGVASVRALVASDRPDADDIELFNLTTALFERGRLAQLIDDNEVARASFAEALDIMNKYLEQEPEDAELLRRQLIFVEHLATADVDMGRYDEAITGLTFVLAENERLYAGEPQNAGYLSDVAQSQYFLAEAYTKADRWPSACSMIIQARVSYDSMADQGTLSPYHQEEVMPDVEEFEAECAARGR